VFINLGLVIALAAVVWVVAVASAAQVAAATGKGRPGVIVIEYLRPARGADIPVGTFTERDRTVTPDVAWQDRPAAVGDRAEGVRVGDRAWAPGVQFGLWEVLVAAAVAVLFLWRLLALITSWRIRRHANA
jgi:hypothetical protein